MELKNRPIGVIDSGLGGLSVLKVLLKELPNEDYIYFGDSKNAPYGTKSKEDLQKLVFKTVDMLRTLDIKALVVACNTTTTTMSKELHERYGDLTIVGIVPAIKEACDMAEGGEVLVMATPQTVKQEAVLKLIEENKERAEITKVGCAGLADMVERNEISFEQLKPYFDVTIKPYISENLKVISLGCTHYPFVKEQLKQYVGELLPGKEVQMIDGSFKTAKTLKEELKNRDLFSENKEQGSLTIMNSLNTDEIIERSFELVEG